MERPALEPPFHACLAHDLVVPRPAALTSHPVGESPFGLFRQDYPLACGERTVRLSVAVGKLLNDNLSV